MINENPKIVEFYALNSANSAEYTRNKRMVSLRIWYVYQLIRNLKVIRNQ